MASRVIHAPLEIGDTWTAHPNMGKHIANIWIDEDLVSPNGRHHRMWMGNIYDMSTQKTVYSCRFTTRNKVQETLKKYFTRIMHEKWTGRFDKSLNRKFGKLS